MPHATAAPLRWRRHCWRMYRYATENSPLTRFAEHEKNTERVANEVAFTALAATDNALLCGMTHRGRELLLAFDPATGEFESLGFPAVAERLEVKLHRGLVRGSDGKFYFGTASLMFTPDAAGAPGGRLWRYDPDSQQFEALGRPLPETYIQSICLDETRQRIYGNTWPMRCFFDYDLNTGQTTSFYVENMPEATPCLDANGMVWGMYGFGYSRYQYLCCYNPDNREMEWTTLDLPGSRQGEKPVAADEIVRWRDHLYFAASGVLARLDVHSRTVEAVGQLPTGAERIPCLTVGPDDNLYGAVGAGGNYSLFRFNGDRTDMLGPIRDDAAACYIPHALCFLDGHLYVGETDSPVRSGYLWEAQLG